MRTLLFATAACLCLLPCRADEADSGISVDALLSEADDLAGQAKSAYDASHDMPASVARNTVLSRAKEAIKLALDKYRILSEIAPAKAKGSASTVSDLKGMLFFCNKGMVIAVPPSLASYSPPTPPPTPLPVDPAPSVPAPVQPDPVPPQHLPLSTAEETAVVMSLGAMRDLTNRIEDIRDSVARRKASIRDIYAVLEASRSAWGAGAAAAGWNQVKAYESRRDALAADARKHQKDVQARLREVQGLDDQVRGMQGLLESYGDRALPCLASWCGKAKEGEVPEALVAYLNRQLAEPRFGFTTVPPGASFPPEAQADPARAKTLKLLDELAKATAREREIALDLDAGALETDRLQEEIKDLNEHWAWRQAHSAWCMDHLKLKVRREEEANQAIARIGAGRGKLDAERSALQARTGILLKELDALDPSMARVLESWRRRQKTLSPAMEQAVEAWTRKALGLAPSAAP
jgi:hypothetical protein